MKHSARTSQVTDRLAALGDPVRLRLLRLLDRQELSVGELAKVVQLPQSTVSRHLKLLHDGAWIVSRYEGTSSLYRLVLDDLPTEARALWLTVREQIGETPELAEDLRRLAAVLAERRLDTQSFFGRVAGEWDAVRNELFGDRVTLAAMLPLLPPHWVVADLGCGTGNAAELLAPIVKRVIAVDQSEPMLSAARKRLAQYKNVEFVRGELEKLPIDSASVDAAVCVLVMHHIPDPPAACREIARVLRPGGTCLIVDMIEHDRQAYKHTMGHRWLGFGVPELIRMLTAAGLENTRCVFLPSDPTAKGPGLVACTATAPQPSARAGKPARS
ncbi:MAG: metalloregulator ArsR/SmtB family transcription factor [Phycisphaeraceae bacterium]|nr:metalloregulator ArsR/SmtB family transcription factor [Phycisphaeraceae bacterium]